MVLVEDVGGGGRKADVGLAGGSQGKVRGFGVRFTKGFQIDNDDQSKGNVFVCAI